MGNGSYHGIAATTGKQEATEVNPWGTASVGVTFFTAYPSLSRFRKADGPAVTSISTERNRAGCPSRAEKSLAAFACEAYG